MTASERKDLIKAVSDNNVKVFSSKKNIVREDRKIYTTADEFLNDIYKLAMRKDPAVLLESEYELQLNEEEQQKLDTLYQQLKTTKKVNDGRR
jgi:hypothetical protein